MRPGSDSMHSGGIRPTIFCTPRCKQNPKGPFKAPREGASLCYMAARRFIAYTHYKSSTSATNIKESLSPALPLHTGLHITHPSYR